MLKPHYLEHVSDSVVGIYLDLELSIMKDISRRLARTGRITSTAEWQIAKMQELGASKEYITKEIAKILKKSETEVLRLFNEAGIKSLAYDERIYAKASQAGYLSNYIPITQSSALQQTLLQGVIRTQGALKNLTNSLALNAFGDTARLMDRAYLQVASGAFDIRTAVDSSVQELARSGIKSLEFSGASISIEAGVRRAVISGINTTSGILSVNRAMEVGSDLVITSEHFGARPEHEEWQGKIFSLSGNSNKYPHFATATRYGEVDGICGINCRHSFTSYFEGISLEPDNDINADRSNELYELEQEQCYNERMIRKWKREEETLNAGGVDSLAARHKVSEWQQRQRDLIDSHDALLRDYNREKVY